MGGGARRRLTKADLEAMLGEFEIAERYGEATSTVNKDLLQVRRNAMSSTWMRARSISLMWSGTECLVDLKARLTRNSMRLKTEKSSRHIPF